MGKLIPLFIIHVLLSSCGILLDGDMQDGQKREFETSDPLFASYVTSFEQDGKTLGQDTSFKVEDIPINFGDTRKSEYDGVCVKYPDGKREILLKRSWWDSSSKQQREILLYHELGHCKLNKSHDKQTIKTTKISIMNPVVPDQASYEKFKLQYLTELYTGNKQGMIDALSL